MTLLELILYLGGAFAVLFVGSELAARAWLKARGAYYVLKPNTTTIMEIDKETLPNLEDEVRVHVNRDGERGGEPPRDWSRTYRVLVAGGSAAECYLLDQDSTWPAVIQRELQRHAAALGVERVHVGNISRSLVACEYLELMLRRVLPRYERLDLVVLMVGASDVVNWLEKKTPAAIVPGQLSADYVFDVHPEGPFGWTFDSLAVRRILSLWHKHLARPVQRKRGVGKTLARNRAMRANAKKMLNVVPDPSPMIEYFELFFHEMVETALTTAKRVLVVRQPWFSKRFTAEERKLLWNFGAGRPYLEEVSIYYTHRVVDELMQKIDASASRIATDLGVEQLDLMPVLERSFETYYDYLHFTPKGAEAVGHAVAEAILAKAPAPSGALPA